MIQSAKKIAIAKNINTGTRIVWHFCRVNSAVVLITAVAILIFLMLHKSTSNETAATPQHTYAIVLKRFGSFNWSIPLMVILFYAVKNATTPKVIMTAKYSIITVHTRHPPHALIKNKNKMDTKRDMKSTAKVIGHEIRKSFMPRSKNPRPKSANWLIVSDSGKQKLTILMVGLTPIPLHPGNTVLFQMQLTCVLVLVGQSETHTNLLWLVGM